MIADSSGRNAAQIQKFLLREQFTATPASPEVRLTQAGVDTSEILFRLKVS
jgi:hypothetical protein